MVLSIDSQIIIWGIKKQATAGQESMIERAEYFFKWVDENHHDVLISTICIGEILAIEPEDIRFEYLNTIKENFIIVDFDIRAALKYAQLMHGRFDEIKKMAEDMGIARQKMKADHLIIASSITNNAKCIYSYDKGLRAFAKGHIDVKDLPQLPPTQSDLFK